MYKEKKRDSNESVSTVIGDIKDKTCIIVDDMADSGGALLKSAAELKKKGSAKVYAFITHGIFSGNAAERIAESEIETVVCTDSIIHDEKTIRIMGDKLHQISIDLFLAEIIRRTVNHESKEELFEVPVYKQL